MSLNFQVTALGNSRAGKTHLLLSMYDTLANHAQQGLRLEAVRIVEYAEEPSLLPIPSNANEQEQPATASDITEYKGLDADAYLRDAYKDVLRKGEWQLGTTTRTLFEFELKASENPIVRLTWIDYKGGAIDGTTVADRDTKQLHADLDRSSTIVVVADSFKLWHEQPQVAVSTTSAARIQRHIRDFRDKHPMKPLAVAIVLSKFDVIEPSDYSEFHQRAYALFDNIVSMVEKPNSKQKPLRGAFIPTSLPAKDGAEYVMKNNDGEFTKSLETTMTQPPSPVNVHLPLVFCIAGELQFQKERLLEEKLRLYEQHSRLERDLASQTEWWQKVITGLFTTKNDDFRTATQALIKKSKELDELERRLAPLLRAANKVTEIDSESFAFTHYGR